MNKKRIITITIVLILAVILGLWLVEQGLFGFEEEYRKKYNNIDTTNQDEKINDRVIIKNGNIENENLIDEFLNSEKGKNANYQELLINQDDDEIKLTFTAGEYIGKTINVFDEEDHREELKIEYGYYSLYFNGKLSYDVIAYSNTLKRVTTDGVVELRFLPIEVMTKDEVEKIVCRYNLSSSSYEKRFDLNYKQRKDLGIEEIAKTDEYAIKTFGGDVDICVEDDMVYSLENALDNNIIKAEQILEQAIDDEKYGLVVGVMYKDGGSMEYLYNEYTILKLNTLDGDKDVIIGMKGAILNNYNKNNTRIDDNEKSQFTCEVIEIKNNSIIVKPDEGSDEAKNNDKIVISTSKFNSEFLVGDKLKITYNGIILKTYPAQIYADNIEYCK